MPIGNLQTWLLIRIALVVCAILASSREAAFAQSDGADAIPLVFVKFRDTNNLRKIPNLELTRPHWGKNGVGLKFSGSCETKATLFNRTPSGLDFGKGDFSIYVDVEVDKGSSHDNWTVMEAKDESGKGGFSLELARASKGELRWRFDLSNNEPATYNIVKQDVSEHIELWVVRKDGSVSILTTPGLSSEPIRMPNAPEKSGALQLRFGYDQAEEHCFEGVLFSAAIWATAINIELPTALREKPWPCD